MSLPIGIIAIWSGAIDDIPPGWHICNGGASTPDLRGLFIIGAGGATHPGDTGGSATHTHNGTTDGHNHTIPGPAPFLQAGAGYDILSSTDTDTFTTDPGNNLPPYYALAYIMRI